MNRHQRRAQSKRGESLMQSTQKFFADAYHLHQAGQLEEASVGYRKVIELAPDFADAHNNLGMVLNDIGLVDDAVASYLRAIQNKPDFANAHYNLGNLLHFTLKRPGDAAICYFRAIQIKPGFAEAHQNLAMALLVQGDMPAGWEEHEWRWQVKGQSKLRSYQQPIWSGKLLGDQPILLWPEQGLGDCIQFVRYAPLLAQTGRKVILEAPPALKRLFETIPGVTVVSEGDSTHDFRVHCPLLSLPRAFRTTLDTIPSRVPYLYPHSAAVAYWREQLAGRPGVKVGVVWRGNPNHKRDQMRSMTSALFSRFLDVPGLSIVSLVKDGRDEECSVLGPQISVLNAGPLLHDMADTAGLIANLDLVISVDTSVCHLAGALGAPVWTLIDHAADWRWLTERPDSPWYPTMRLFRQRQTGDWTSVVEDVQTALSSFAERIGGSANLPADGACRRT